jgi:CHAT domain-containing protein/Tfp pilus assembly protein PilF
MGEWQAARLAFTEALEIRRELAEAMPDTYRPDLAATLSGLGNVLSNVGELAAARDAFQESLAIRRELAAAPDDLAMTLNNIGILLRQLRELPAARKTFQEALTIYRDLARQAANYWPDVAMSLSNLGAVLSDLGELPGARDAFQEALEIRRALAEVLPKLYRPEVALTLNNLGVVLRELGEFPAAREAFQEALPIFRSLAEETPALYRPALSGVLQGLGNLLHELGEWEAARKAIEEALQIRRELALVLPAAYRPEVAVTLNNLGNVLLDLGELKAAQAAYEEALTYFQEQAVRFPTASLPERLRCWSNLGRLLLRDAPELGWPDRQAARTYFREARTCAEQFRGTFVTPKERQWVQQEALHVYEGLIRTCVDLWDTARDLSALREAVETAEASRARNLMEMLAEETLEPENTPADLVAEFRTLRKQLRNAMLLLASEERRSCNPEVESPGSPDRRDLGGSTSADPSQRTAEHVAVLRQEVEQLQQKQQELLGRIHQHDAGFDPDRPVAPIDCATAQRLVPDDVPSAVIHYTIIGDRGLALLLTRDAIEVVPLPRLGNREAFELVQQWYDAYYGARGNFDEAIPSLLEPVSERAVRPVMERLAGRGIQRLILAPNRALHLFPLHACTLADGRTLLANACEVVYTPSLSILDRCARRQRQHRRDLLLVENPTADLPFTEIEGQQLRRRYTAHLRLHGSRATREKLLNEAGRFHVFNYTGHATFDPQEPLRSALVLGDKDDEAQWLTLRDIFCGLHLPRNWLTVINGCESGMLLPDQLDELVMLPTGLLYAGAACVLCTLWRVYDLSSALLVDRFHREWLGDNPDDPSSGRSIGAALREAQRWLRQDVTSGVQLQRELLPILLDGVRDSLLRRKCEEQAAHYARRYPDRPPFASPAHWAAFTATGLAYPLRPPVSPAPASE